jgi:hypothetical protein
VSENFLSTTTDTHACDLDSTRVEERAHRNKKLYVKLICMWCESITHICTHTLASCSAEHAKISSKKSRSAGERSRCRKGSFFCQLRLRARGRQFNKWRVCVCAREFMLALLCAELHADDAASGGGGNSGEEEIETIFLLQPEQEQFLQRATSSSSYSPVRHFFILDSLGCNENAIF